MTVSTFSFNENSFRRGQSAPMFCFEQIQIYGVIVCMGACAAQFRHKTYRQPLPSVDCLNVQPAMIIHDGDGYTSKLDLLKHSSQKMVLKESEQQLQVPVTIDIVQVASASTKHKDVFDRQSVRPIIDDTINKKQSISKTMKLNEKILQWIDNGQNASMSPPESMLSLDAFVAREHDPPRRVTNRQEVATQRLRNRRNINIDRSQTNDISF